MFVHHFVSPAFESGEARAFSAMEAALRLLRSDDAGNDIARPMMARLRDNGVVEVFPTRPAEAAAEQQQLAEVEATWRQRQAADYIDVCRYLGQVSLVNARAL